MKILYIKSLILCIVILHCACKKFIEIDPPKENLSYKTVFQSDDVATSAITGIYSRMASTLDFRSIPFVCGLSADEFKNYNTNLIEFYENSITVTNTTLSSLYSLSYANIYTSNAILEGLDASNGLTQTVKTQLEGEAYFIRAFQYFYLVNLFGAIPIQLESDYQKTRLTSRSNETQVYQQIISDLKAAEVRLTDNYVTTERVRPNLATIYALLARTYLYTQDWTNAEKYATLVINKSNIYNLVSLENVFLKNSQEAIWQLVPPINTNTTEGNLFILTTTPQYVSLNSAFISNSFEPTDRRLSTWVKSFSNNTGTYYFPFKYKIKTTTNNVVNEYSMVMRLAEQYLIRAESRAQQSNLTGAIEDLDKIRIRAGLPSIIVTIPGINQSSLLNAILKERRVELFSEWGHRWMDLKRTGQATIVLGSTKPQWSTTDILYPIPYNEISRNPNITQNPGY